MKEEEKNITDNIKTIRQTKEENMLITLRGNEKKTGEVRNILNKIGDIRSKLSVGNGGKRTTLNIKDIDAITTKEEIMMTICRESEINKELVRIGELHPFHGSSKAVTVSVPKTAAEKLTKVGKIRIECNWCKVEERINPTQCYKCWEYGHKMAMCLAGADRRGDCRNCGEKGHQQKDCDRKKYCPVCNMTGPRARTGGYPEMRHALRMMRERLLRIGTRTK